MKKLYFILFVAILMGCKKEDEGNPYAYTIYNAVNHTLIMSKENDSITLYSHWEKEVILSSGINDYKLVSSDSLKYNLRKTKSNYYETYNYIFDVMFDVYGKGPAEVESTSHIKHQTTLPMSMSIVNLKSDRLLFIGTGLSDTTVLKVKIYWREHEYITKEIKGKKTLTIDIPVSQIKNYY